MTASSSRPRRPRLGRTVVALVAAAVSATLTLGGCSADRPAPAASPSHGASATPTGSPTPSTTPTPTPSGVVSPLTGLRVAKLSPVLVAKIGNTSRERPPIGVDAADVVYVEMVEGGLTRLAAVFSSHLPRKIGPVRSARETDVELLWQYGAAALAYSGVDGHVVPLLAHSPLRLVSFDANTRGYVRDPGRGHAPYNVVGTTATLLARAPKAALPRDIGFRFGAAPAGGQAVSTMTARYPLASVAASWDAAARRWRMSMDGRPAVTAGGVRLTGSTVVVQYVREETLNRRDAARTRVPKARTLGSGTGVVLRDGRAYPARWSRPTLGAPTTWTVGGKRATFAPGQVWVLLVPTGRPVTLR